MRQVIVSIGSLMRHTKRCDAYRASAMNCAKLAEVVDNPITKATLLVMAAGWLRLADYVEQTGWDEVDELCPSFLADIHSEDEPGFK